MGDVFEAATGDEVRVGGAPMDEAGRAARAAEVRAAFAGLLQIRRLTGSVPAEWERNRMVRAVALTLEAAGVPASAVDEEGLRVATGYRVRVADREGAVRVDWVGPAGSGAAHEEETRLAECVRALDSASGWECLRYRGARGRRYLEVEVGGG